MSLRCVERKRSGLTEVTLTFRRRAHHCRLVSMATVAGDERPAPALAHTVLVATATQALVVEEARAGAELRVLQGRADLTVGTGRKKKEIISSENKL